MRRLPALVVALVLPAAQPILLGTAAFTGSGLVFHASVQAQSVEAVAKVAQTITVRIEGATQGSGVLVKREGNRYTVLTVWHVVSEQRPGEELAVYTSDGRSHSVDGRSIQQIDGADLASLTFASGEDYATARAGSGSEIKIGSRLYVGGFPLPTTAVPSRLFRFLEGRSIASTSQNPASGYGLLYSNSTFPGMIGGPVLDEAGLLVSVHGRGETDSQLSEQQGVAVKTGTNQGIPIDRWQGFKKATANFSSSFAQALASRVPATEAEMNLYTRIAAVNVCIARGAGVPFDKAIGVAGETIAQLLRGQHDGVITQVSSSQLSIDELRKGSINSAVLGAAEICPNEVPPDVMTRVRDALKK